MRKTPRKRRPRPQLGHRQWAARRTINRKGGLVSIFSQAPMKGSTRYSARLCKCHTDVNQERKILTRQEGGAFK